ncbi:MAG: folylpolyglutamate synthase/dihydrofolate synthase family protein [Dehalococcoidia bacterium]|nr:folylpolyglutamate synthase/dihydrofolate synthase family protein [Dehalococcoidia bacterium]
MDSGQCPAAPPGTSYPDALQYLLSFADFERSGRFQDRPDVAPMLALLQRLGDPHLGRPTVHIAGSKGKGSVAAMVDSVLRADGLTTGLYTSPHLHSYTERVRINGEPVSEETFARLTGALRPAVDAVQAELGERRLVTFDLLTALAFLAFREAGVRAQVVEVGLGGRVDSTNVFPAKEAAVITPLSLEHTAVLGDTIEQIAREKAGIITPGCVAVLAPQPHQAAREVVLQAARAAGARVVDVAGEYRWRRLAHDLRGQRIRIEGPRGPIEARLPLLGAHQIENAATAVATVEALAPALPRAGLRPAPTGARDGWGGAIVRGLESVRWPCRLEVLRERPLVIADGAHNRDSAGRLREALRDYFSCERAIFIVGASSDKDIAGLAQEIAPVAGAVIAARARHPRAMDPALIAAEFGRRGVPAEIVDSVAGAVERAMAVAGAGGVICLLGSLFIAAEGREYILGCARE